MTRDEIVGIVKQIIATGRGGDADASYAAYKDLFADPRFADARPEDQRQALKLLILQKRTGPKPPILIEAHRAAIPALTNLVSNLGDPEDYEMLGVCHVMLGNEQGASTIFREALALERARSPQSDLCGRLMTRISAL